MRVSNIAIIIPYAQVNRVHKTSQKKRKSLFSYFTLEKSLADQLKLLPMTKVKIILTKGCHETGQNETLTMWLGFP